MVKDILKTIIKRLFIKIYGHDDNLIAYKGNIGNLKADRKTILFAPDGAWNTIEHILPVLVYLKKHYDVNIIVYILTKQLAERAAENKQMFALLCDTADVLYLYGYAFEHKDDEGWLIAHKYYRFLRPISWITVHKYYYLLEPTIKYIFDNVKVNAILRIYYDMDVAQYFKDFHPETKHVGTGHAAFSGMFSPQPEDVSEKFWHSNLKELDRCILTDKYVALVNFLEATQKIRRLGAPQYDKWWRDMIAVKIPHDTVKAFTGNRKKVLVILPHISPDKAEYFLDSEKMALYKFINDYKDKYDFVFKFHPRQAVGEILAYMEQFNDNSIRYVTAVTIFDIAKMVDYAIVVGMTTSTMDLLVAGVVVTEFYEGRDNGHFRKIADRVYGTFVREHGLAPHAGSYEELCEVEKSIFAGNNWQQYKDKYMEYLPVDNCSCKRWAEEIMEVINE